MAVAFIAILLGGGLAAPAAQATPPPKRPEAPVNNDYITPEFWEKTRKQEPFVKAAKAIGDVLEKQPASKDTGFTGMKIEDDNKLVLFWHGSVLPAVTDTIAKQKAPIEVRQAPYSRQQLVAAQDRIIAQAKTAKDESIHSIKIPVSGTHLRVLTANKEQVQARTLGPAAVAGVPVELAYGKPATPVSRCDDGSPWYGGAGIRNSVLPYGRSGSFSISCSSGWGVKDNSGKTYVLTARHCGAVRQRFYDGAGQLIGRCYLGNQSQDVLLIDAPGGSRMWDGSTDLNSFSKAVIGWYDAPAGSGFCVSGAKTGANCFYVVDEYETTNRWRNGNPTESFWSYGFSEARRAGGITVQGGDSGGPVFMLGGSDSVYAIGIINLLLDEDGDGAQEGLAFMGWRRMRDADGFSEIVPIT